MFTLIEINRNSIESSSLTMRIETMSNYTANPDPPTDSMGGWSLRWIRSFWSALCFLSGSSAPDEQRTFPSCDGRVVRRQIVSQQWCCAFSPAELVKCECVRRDKISERSHTPLRQEEPSTPAIAATKPRNESNETSHLNKRVKEAQEMWKIWEAFKSITMEWAARSQRNDEGTNESAISTEWRTKKCE